MKRFGGVVGLILVSSLAIAQTATSTPGTKKTAAPKRAAAAKKPTTAQEIEDLKAQMQAQQDQINSLKNQLSSKDSQLSSATQQTAAAQQAAQTAQSKADAATSNSQATQDEVKNLQTTVNDLKTVQTGTQETIIAQQAKINDAIESPSAIHYKGITITPVAFFAAEGVWRQKSVNSDINTPLNSIPFPSAPEGHVSELNFSGRQSRIGGLFEGNAGNFKLSGYFEADFLGTGTTSNNNQSDSYVLRQRQFWGRVESKGGFAMTGGQMWSLVTENRRYTDNRTEIQPQTIDPQYIVGYTWTRQPGFRIQQKFGKLNTGAFTGAIAVEQAQITGFTAGGTNPTEYFFGGLGQNGGLYNAAGSGGATGACTQPGSSAGSCLSNITLYANNVAPDVILKGAFDLPKFHLEIGGIGRWLRNEYYPVTWGGTASAPTFTYDTTHGLKSNTASAGGVFGAARVYLGKITEVAVQGMAGTGVGRYGSAQLADATLRPDEKLEPVKNYHGTFSLENHISPKFDVFAYYGGEYAQRTQYTTPVGSLVGYGPRNLNNSGCYALPNSIAGVSNPGAAGGLGGVSCGGVTRYIQEAVFGFQYRPIVSSKWGRLQYSATYTYLQRNLWSGTGGNTVTTPYAPRAVDPMIHVQMRYYIP